MRITIVTPSLAAGGAERSVVLLSEGFLGQGHTVSVVTIYGSDGTAADFFKLPSGVHRLALDIAADSSSFINGLWNNLKRILTLRKAIRKTQPDIVISNLTQTNVLTTLALTNTHYPLVVIEHSDPVTNARARVWQKLRRAIYPRAAMLVSVSQNINDYFTWLPEAKKTVIPNPVSVMGTEVSPDDLLAEKAPREKWLVAMGRLIRIKGFDRLLAAFATVAPKHEDWHLIIIGEGELKAELEQMIASLGLTGRVQLKGLISRPAAILRNSEFFVMASRSEGFPYALLEAMSCGLPAIAMDCASGPREIIRDGLDGILVPEGDVEALAIAMDRLMKDEGERRRLAAHAPDVLERFGVDQVIAQWEALFRKIKRDRE